MPSIETVRVYTQNGLAFEDALRDIFHINKVTDYFQIEDAGAPERADVVLFGPYGDDFPAPGQYMRVGYICENYLYDGPEVDFVFTVSDQHLTLPDSARIIWHGLDPQRLLKPEDLDFEKIATRHTYFCNFVYSNPISYREQLFRELSKYKRIDAPGRSMNNANSIDAAAMPGESCWKTKRRFLSQYKFTLALESEIHPWYRTEKLYDAMQALSIPIYIGDPTVGDLFNTKSFVCGLSDEAAHWKERLRDFGQSRWSECQGGARWTYRAKLARHARNIAKDLRHRWLLQKYIRALVDTVVALDRDPIAYARMLREPWLYGNRIDESAYSTNIWTQLFEKALQRRLKRAAWRG